VVSPTWSRLRFFTTKRISVRLVLRWRTADQRGVAGFNLYAGGHRLNGVEIAVRPSHSSRITTHPQAGPYVLSILLLTGRHVDVRLND